MAVGQVLCQFSMTLSNWTWQTELCGATERFHISREARLLEQEKALLVMIRDDRASQK
jgi:hypothetical protein